MNCARETDLLLVGSEEWSDLPDHFLIGEIFQFGRLRARASCLLLFAELIKSFLCFIIKHPLRRQTGVLLECLQSHQCVIPKAAVHSAVPTGITTGDEHPLHLFHFCSAVTNREPYCSIAVQLSRDLLREISQSGIEPVPWTAFICKPPVDSDNHLVRLWSVVQGLVLVSDGRYLRRA